MRAPEFRSGPGIPAEHGGSFTSHKGEGEQPPIHAVVPSSDAASPLPLQIVETSSPVVDRRPALATAGLPPQVISLLNERGLFKGYDTVVAAAVSVVGDSKSSVDDLGAAANSVTSYGDFVSEKVKEALASDDGKEDGLEEQVDELTDTYFTLLPDALELDDAGGPLIASRRNIKIEPTDVIHKLYAKGAIEKLSEVVIKAYGTEEDVLEDVEEQQSRIPPVVSSVPSESPPKRISVHYSGQRRSEGSVPLAALRHEPPLDFRQTRTEFTLRRVAAGLPDHPSDFTENPVDAWDYFKSDEVGEKIRGEQPLPDAQSPAAILFVAPDVPSPPGRSRIIDKVRKIITGDESKTG